MPQFSNHKYWEFFKDFLAINLGLALYALGWAVFLLPYHITTGALTGICAIIYYVTSFPMSYSLIMANGVLLLMALKQLGWKFTLKTAYAVFALSTYLELGQKLITDDAGNLIQILGEGQDTMACIIGAIFNGIGIGVVFLAGGSTGGTDIIAAVINKYKNVSLGRVILFMDFFIIGSCLFIFNDWHMVVFGYVTLAIYTYTLDMVINSTRQDVQFIIFTRMHKAIGDRIIHETTHSVTVINGEGYYSHQEMKILITIAHKRESVQILRMIHEVDPSAFVSQSRVEGVYGNGFNPIKT